jgi:S-DNA-T family DNA segregation ATPase FtsK/SpoIIIE
VAGGRLASLLGDRLVLDLPDPLDLAMAGVKDAPAGRRPPGRAIDARTGTLVQLAFVAPGAGGAGLEKHCGGGQHAPAPRLRIRPLPSRVPLTSVVDPAPGVVPVGPGGDDGGWVGFDEDRHRRLLVTGPSRSGRSTALAAIAEGALALGRAVALVGGRPSPLSGLATQRGLTRLRPADAPALERLLAESPTLCLLADDAHLLEGSAVEHLLGDLARDEAHPALVAAAVETSRVTGLYRGIVPELAKHGCGLLLQPRTAADGDVLRVRVTPLHARVPGRGFLVTDGETTPVQVALPPEAAEPGGDGPRTTVAARTRP